MTVATVFGNRAAINWRALRFFNFYRLIISGLFVVLVLTKNLPPPLGADNLHVFRLLAYAYLLTAIALQVLLERRLVTEALQVLAEVLADVLFITGMMYASGGVASGFGMLLVTTIAGGSLLSPGRMAFFYAACAALAVLGEEIYAYTVDLRDINYTQAGFLGGSYFVTALMAYLLARRIRESEALAEQRGQDLANLARLNEHIVQRMQSGVLVLDVNGGVRLSNDAARRLLGLEKHPGDWTLNELPFELVSRYRHWCANGAVDVTPLRVETSGMEVMSSFLALEQGGALVFLEDAAMTRQRAQQLKLASLGRLTASIAHEIRNPLGAISHAAQLLSEPEAADAENRQLTRIIHEHSQRVNTIIENVMSLSRRDTTAPERLLLRDWLDKFVTELNLRYQLPNGAVAVSLIPGDMVVRVDPSQLHQILWNLCENALRYSHERLPRLELRGHLHPQTRRPCLDVIDYGPGVPTAARDHIFEPFFTTEHTGTGLGLYLAAELCEANQAGLTLHANGPQGCCFRIQFAPVDRLRQLA
ncbi:MAG TPA: ATP-binding protein [Gammaproteobacteria bacterium]|nr:ATP-binding protein [Gammaproteobacteria bacterium]